MSSQNLSEIDPTYLADMILNRALATGYGEIDGLYLPDEIAVILNTLKNSLRNPLLVLITHDASFHENLLAEVYNREPKAEELPEAALEELSGTIEQLLADFFQSLDSKINQKTLNDIQLWFLDTFLTGWKNRGLSESRERSLCLLFFRSRNKHLQLR